MRPGSAAPSSSLCPAEMHHRRCRQEIGLQQALLTAETAGGKHQLSKAAQLHAGASGPLLRRKHHHAGRGHRLFTGLSGCQLVSAGVFGVDGEDDPWVSEREGFLHRIIFEDCFFSKAPYISALHADVRGLFCAEPELAV